MTDYRSPLSDLDKTYGEKLAIKKYSKHIGAGVGLFNKDSRQKLLEKNPKMIEIYDTPHFWSKIKKTTHNGLIDIQLLCEIASSTQLKKIFQHTPDFPDQGKRALISEEESLALSTNLTSVIDSILTNTNDDPKNDMWSAELAKRIMMTCMDFILKNGLIKSPLYEDHLRLVDAIIESELSRYR